MLHSCAEACDKYSPVTVDENFVQDDEPDSIDEAYIPDLANVISLPSGIHNALNGFCLTDSKYVFKINSHFHSEMDIQTMKFVFSRQFKNLLKGSTSFTLQDGIINNHRPVWSNGVEYLYHMATGDDRFAISNSHFYPFHPSSI